MILRVVRKYEKGNLKCNSVRNDADTLRCNVNNGKSHQQEDICEG